MLAGSVRQRLQAVYADASLDDAAKLAAFNAANGTAFLNALAWMKADFADDGILQQAGNLQIAGAGLAAEQFNIENTAIICFAAGTMILTAEGERAIETLTAGDMVWTLDHGYQPLRWIGAGPAGSPRPSHLAKRARRCGCKPSPMSMA